MRTTLSRRKALTGLTALLFATTTATISVVATQAPAMAASSVGGQITRSEVLARAQFWVNQGTIYSPNAPDSYSWAPDSDGKVYRADCSGLVSMAWHINNSPTSYDFQAGAGPSHTLGSLNDLLPGDAVVRPGHIELFSHWKNPANHLEGAYVYSFNSRNETVQNPYANSNQGNRGFNSWSDMQSYTPIRYNNIVGDGVEAQVYEAASDRLWGNMPVSGTSGGVTGTGLASLALGAEKLVYTIKGGKVYEASSANAWQNNHTGISGVTGSGIASIEVNGTKYVYTIVSGQVYEASSANGWQNLATGITGVSESALAAINFGGTKLVYTIKSGKIHEASSAAGWQNLSTGVSGATVSAIGLNGVKFLYTLSGSQVMEATSANGWTPLAVSGASGPVTGSAVTALPYGGVKLVYTINGGKLYEANSGAGWQNDHTGVNGVAGSKISVINFAGVKNIYTQ